MSPRYYSCLLLLHARSKTKRCIVALYVGAFSHRHTRRVRGAKRVALLSAPVIDYIELCCQGFLTIRACRRACNLTIGRLTPPYTSRGGCAKNYENLVVKRNTVMRAI